MARWVLGEDSSEASSSDEDDFDFEADHLQNDAASQPIEPPAHLGAARKKISIKLNTGAGSGSNHAGSTCHVCGEKGHVSGFFGATYIDCINKPCYLCGQSGHRTNTCPHRVSPGHGCSHASDVVSTNLVSLLAQREQQGPLGTAACAPDPRPGQWQIDAAVLKLHARRTTCLEFHPNHPSLVLSGDKKGQVAVWNLDKVFERTVYTGINKWLTNALRVMPFGDAACATASYDGTVKIFDIEIGSITHTLFDANPGGWDNVEAEDAAGRWITMIACDVIPQGPGIVVAGDSKGKILLLDPRASTPAAEQLVHKKNTKVQCVNVHPQDSNLLLSAGNDYQARILDVRCLGNSINSAEVLTLAHSKVINAAYWSPISGRKIMTTAQDNRIRVWDDWVSSCSLAPNREIVHSHTFNRYLTPFKAEWDPKDPSERLAIIGRYISENFGNQALHPIDIIDTATGSLLGELVDPNLTTISPVNKPHPQRDIIVSGSSRSLYAWKPAELDGDRDQEVERENRGGAGMSAGCSKWAAGALPRGSANYVFFDADENEGKKGSSGAGSKRKGGTNAGLSGGGKPLKHQEDDDEDNTEELIKGLNTNASKKGKRPKKDDESEDDD